MSPYTPEEKVARDYLLSNHADSILNVVDATNLERNLYLTTQLIETGIPVTVALNMSDALKGQGKRLISINFLINLVFQLFLLVLLKMSALRKLLKKQLKLLKKTLIPFNILLIVINLKRQLNKLLIF